MNKKTIEFASPEDLTKTASPWSPPRTSSFRNLVLTPEYRSRIFRFPEGETKVRVVPPIAGSTRDWLLGCQVLKYSGGQHLHARTLKPRDSSVFDVAYRWCLKNQPDSLYSKRNPDGYRLLTDPLSICCMLVESPDSGAVTVKWLVAGAYDGSRGGVPGLGHIFWKAFQDKDEHGKLVADPADPEGCPQLIVNRVQPKGTRYPSYSLRVGRSPSPIEDWLARMEPSEMEQLRPLEEVIHLPTPEEEWRLLENVMPPELILQIRADS